MDNRYSTTRSNYIFKGFTGHSTGEKENSFCFQKRGGKIDWKKVAAIDVDNFEHEYNINVLQDNIDNFVFCCIESEIDVKTMNPLFVKLFKVGQLIAEYLLHSQDHLITIIEKMQQKSPKPGNELLKEKYEYNAENEHAHQTSEKPSNKNPVVQQVTGAVSCTFCYKVFESSKYVIKHIMRRHPEELAAGIKNINNPSQPSQETDCQKEVIDFVAKEMHELKQSLEKIKCEIERNVASVAESLSNKDKRGAFGESANVIQFLNNWKQEEEERQRADLGKIEREFTNKLHKLNLKVNDAEHVIQSLEEKWLLSMEEVRKELFQMTESATRELLEKYRMGFSEIKSELQEQLADSHEKCLAKLIHQDSQLKEAMAEIHRENNAELQQFKLLLETTLSKLNSIDNVHDLQQELKRYLDLCCAKSQRRVQKKQGKLKPKGRTSQSVTQNIFGQSLASKDSFHVAESTSGEISKVKQDGPCLSSKHKEIHKAGKHPERARHDWVVDDAKVVPTHKHINPDSRSLHGYSESKTNAGPIMVRPVLEKRSEVEMEEHFDTHEQRVLERCEEAKIMDGSAECSAGVKVCDESKSEANDVSLVSRHSDIPQKVKTKSKGNSAVVNSWVQGNDIANDKLGAVSAVRKFELQNDSKTDFFSLGSEEEGYHITKRLQSALHISPDLVNGLRREVLNIVKDKMEKVGVHESFMTNEDFSVKMELISSEKQSSSKKYRDFSDIRNWYNKYADQTAELQMHKVGTKRRISFANPEVTAEVKRSSSEETDEVSDYPGQNNEYPPVIKSSDHSETLDFNAPDVEGEIEPSFVRTRMCQSLPVASKMRRLPPKPESVIPYSSPEDLSSEGSEESFGYPFKEHMNGHAKEQEECDELDDDSTSGKELSSWDGDDLSS